MRRMNKFVEDVREGVGLSAPQMKYLSQQEADDVEKDLLSLWSQDCLTEMFGYSVALALREAFYYHTRVVVLCGSGRKGKIGLASARYLTQFGFECRVLLDPSAREDNEKAMAMSRIPVFGALPALWEETTDVVVDGLDDQKMLSKLKAIELPVLSIDVPCGWDLEKKKSSDFQPEVLVSLVAPKRSALDFKGQAHFLGGRFAPVGILEKYGIQHPPFQGANQIVRIDRHQSSPFENEEDDDDEEEEPEYYYF